MPVSLDSSLMYIKVRVVTGGKRESVTKVDDTTYEVVVREKAERNLANTRIREILRDEYGVTIGSVRIISGHHSQSKIFDIDL